MDALQLEGWGVAPQSLDTMDVSAVVLVPADDTESWSFSRTSAGIDSDLERMGNEILLPPLGLEGGAFRVYLGPGSAMEVRASSASVFAVESVSLDK